MEQKQANEFTFSMLLKLGKANKRFIITFTLIVSAVVIIYSLIMPQTYESTATLLPPQDDNNSTGLGSFLQSLAGGGGLMIGGIGRNNQVQIFQEILQSRSTAEYIANKFHLDKHPYFKTPSKLELYKAIQSMLQVELERSGRIVITGSFTTPYFSSTADQDSAAEFSAELANTAIEALDNILRQKNVTKAQRTRIYIEAELDKYHAKLDSVSMELENFQKKNKVLSLDEQTTALMSQAAEVGVELNKAIIDLSFEEQEYKENSPKVKAYKEAVDVLQKQYEKIQKGGLIKSDMFSVPFDEIPELMRIYTNLLREREILEQVILYLETQRHQESIQEARDVPIVNILDDAVIPEKRSSPSRTTMALAGFFLSFILGYIIVIFRSAYREKINDED